MISDVFYLKFVGTTNDETSYSAMVSATTLDTDRFEIEIAILWLKPDRTTEGESRVTWGGAIWKSRRKRRQFEVECFPFSNHEAVAGEILQNTDDLETLYEIIDMPYVWIAEPEITGHILPPRYTDATNFPKTAVLLPLMVECDDPATSKTDVGDTEVTITLDARNL